MSEGHLGVDIFFVISGFLIGSMLLSELRQTGRLSLARFYTRRLFRIVPAYMTVLALALGLGLPNCSNTWLANLLFVNNFVPHTEQCMAWTWSLAIEEQFYLVFPAFVIGMHFTTKRYFLVLVGLLALGFALNGWLVAIHGFNSPVSLNERIFGDEFVRYIDLLYGKTYTRFGGILSGVILAYLLHYSPLLQAMRKHARLATAALVAAVVGLGALIFWPGASAQSAALPPLGMSVFLASHRYVFALLVAYVLAFALTTWERPSLVARFLSWRRWRPLAEISYGAYLLHPIVVISIYSATLGAIQITPARMYGAVVINLVLSLSLAVPLYYFVERPLRGVGRRLGERSRHPEGTPAHDAQQ